VVKHPAEMQRIEIAGICAQDALVDPLSLAQFPAPMQSQGLLDRAGCGPGTQVSPRLAHDGALGFMDILPVRLDYDLPSARFSPRPFGLHGRTGGLSWTELVLRERRCKVGQYG
jgi:hypothetical protein